MGIARYRSVRRRLGIMYPSSHRSRRRRRRTRANDLNCTRGAKHLPSNGVLPARPADVAISTRTKRVWRAVHSDARHGDRGCRSPRVRMRRSLCHGHMSGMGVARAGDWVE
jgi:hypothetical protein